MRDYEFGSEFPHAEIPILPEYFKKVTLEGLLPQEMAFPYSHLIGFDALTQVLCIKSRMDIDTDAPEPDYMTGRAGVLRVHEVIDGQLVSGFIADLRHVRYGDLDSLVFNLPEDAGDIDKEYHDKNIEEDGIQPLLAAVFIDPDDNLHYMGDRRLQERTQALIERVDELATDEVELEAVEPDTSVE